MFRRTVTVQAALLGGALLVVLAMALSPVAAQEKERAEDQAAVSKRTGDFVKALDAGDAKAVAAFWTDSGEYMRGDDLVIRGRAAIEKAYAEHLKKRKPGTVEMQSDSIRFLSDDTAIQEGTFVVKRTNPAESTRNRFSILCLRVKGQWQFGLMREHDDGPSLQDLAWLVGAWTWKAQGADVRTTFAWTANKKFLRCDFTIKREERNETGTQILGVGPATGEIKSWTFESDGGIGETVWTRTEKGWTGKATGATVDGVKVTATIHLIPTDENTFTYQSVDRTVDGEKVPDLEPVKAVREKARGAAGK